MRTRTGLVAALLIGGAAALALGLFPHVDLAVTRLLMSKDAFAFNAGWLLDGIRNGSVMVIVAVFTPAAVALIFKILWPRGPLFLRGRAAVLIVSTFLIGPILTANTLLKDNWGRPRPRDIVEFGGALAFLPWWDPRGACPTNCSFVAGEASGAFWTISAASVAPPQWRPLAYAGALAFGGFVGVMRIIFGGHFLSDVVLAGLFMFLIVWIAHGLLYRWSRITDEGIERALARLGFALRRPFGSRAVTPAPASEPPQHP